MLDLPVLFPLAALKPTTATANDVAAAAAPAASAQTAAPAGAPPVAPLVSAPPTTPSADAALTSTTSTTQTNGGEAAPAKPNPYASLIQIALIGGVFVMLYFVMFRGQRKTEKDRKTLISTMKKGDRVMTIGGLVARVVSIDADDVVLKIDESANVKATYKKSSIQQILDRDEKTK